MDPFTIALPAGRLADESIDFFRDSGLANFEIPPSSRELSFFDTTGDYQILLLRNQDIPTYVLQGAADAGIAGRDLLAERGIADMTIPLELGFGDCRLSVAAPESSADSLYSKPHIRVATKYPNLASDYFFSRGISCEVIKLYGSIEVAPILGLSDCIVDLVSTGGTLRANGLRELDPILYSTAMLLVSRSAYAQQSDRLNLLLEKFRARLQAKRSAGSPLE